MRTRIFVGIALIITGAPLVAAPATVRYEADLQVIATRLLGGQDRQVIQTGRRVVELGEDFYRKTDELGDEKTIMESSPKEVVHTTIRNGITTIQKFDNAAINRETKRFLGDRNAVDPSDLAARLSKQFGLEVKFTDLKSIGSEKLAGVDCTITEYTVIVGDDRQQVIRWQPKDPDLRKAFDHLQRYTYKLVGEGSWLQHAEVVRNVKAVRN